MHKSGFVSILGRPNVGKSSFVNAIMKEKVVIVADKPQTTRNQIKAIYNEPECQIVFLDTPGWHKSKNELSKFMNSSALSALKGTETILFFTPATDKDVHSLDRALMEIMTHRNLDPVLVLTKVDLVDQTQIDKRLNQLKEYFDFKRIIEISSVKDIGIDQILLMIKDHLVDAEPFYPKDITTDATDSFTIGEIIREKALHVLQQEVPHSIGVMIEHKEYDPEEGVFKIKAAIVVERDSQKGIVIGAKGSKIKEIGTLARQELLSIYDARVYLELFVKVEKDWRKSLLKVRELGYNK